MLKQVEHGELSATSFMDQIADMSRTLVKEHTTPEERFADLFPSSKGTAHEAVGYVPAAVPRYLKERKVFSAATGNVLLLFGKITVSFPARKNLSQSLWQRLF